MGLKSSIKKDGVFFDKVQDPAKTVAWAKERFQAMGTKVFEEAVRIDKGRLGIPVYISKYTPDAIRLTGTAKQMGKGAVPEQAEASAVMELSERYSLFHFKEFGKRQLVQWSQLNGQDTMEMNELFSALHVETMGGADEERIKRCLLALPMEWVRGYSPKLDQEVLVPWSWFWPINEYNGSAAGNSLEEASVQAICELVERHVSSLVTYKRCETPTIDPDSFRHPMAIELIEKFRKCKINLVLKDFTLEMGVPSVGAIAWDPSTYPHRSEIVYTAGTAPDPERAAIRAITEVAQLAGDFDTDGKYVESGLPKFATLDEASYVLASPSTVGISDLPSIGNEDFRKEVMNLVDVLGERGFNVYLIDITHPMLGVPAVYAIMPGNHFRDRTINGDMVFHMAKIAASIKDKAMAEGFLSTLDDAFPGRYYVAFFRGYLEELQGHFKDALLLYQDALKRGVEGIERASVHCHLGLCYKEIGEIGAAISELENAKAINPGLKEIYNILGTCYYLKGDYVKAIEEFEQAIEIDPGSSMDYANIGSNLRKLGMNTLAVKWYEMALSLDPSIEWAWQHLEELRAQSES